MQRLSVTHSIRQKILFHHVFPKALFFTYTVLTIIFSNRSLPNR